MTLDRDDIEEVSDEDLIEAAYIGKQAALANATPTTRWDLTGRWKKVLWWVTTLTVFVCWTAPLTLAGIPLLLFVIPGLFFMGVGIIPFILLLLWRWQEVEVNDE